LSNISFFRRSECAANDNKVVPPPTPPTLNLHLGDCLDVLKAVADSSVHLVAIDPPYNTTRLQWDKAIPFEELWPELRRILTPTGTVVMTAAQPFTSMAVMSAPDLFKFAMVWKKSRATGHLLSKNRPMMQHEDVLVFSKGVTAHPDRSSRRMTYNPQGMVELETPIRTRNGRQSGLYNNNGQMGGANGFHHFDGKGYQTFNGGRVRYKDEVRVQTHTGFPTSILSFDSVHMPVHSTQKPVELFDYLIRTFSNPGDVVMDPTMGSGTTGVAALAAGRHFIGVERDPVYFQIASGRINGAFERGKEAA